MHFETSSSRNLYYPCMNLILPHSNTPSSNPAFLIKLLRSALQTSLQRFTACSIQKSSFHQNTPQLKKPQKIEPQVIEVLSSEEQVEMNDEKREEKEAKKMDVVECEEKTDSSKDHDQFEKQFNRNSEKEEENSARKTWLIKKQKGSKGSLKMKKHKYIKVEQNLDLTETVEVRSLPFSVDELNKKREALAMRTVCNWQEAGFEKKERRQIRMLKN